MERAYRKDSKIVLPSEFRKCVAVTWLQVLVELFLIPLISPPCWGLVGSKVVQTHSSETAHTSNEMQHFWGFWKTPLGFLYLIFALVHGCPKELTTMVINLISDFLNAASVLRCRSFSLHSLSLSFSASQWHSVAVWRRVIQQKLFRYSPLHASVSGVWPPKPR